mmetsp:Transcript_14278/g.34352  ORF Transcript_14278/g.34352 Transcript_14278/m.34352 type:complete len:268 (+) Transcript_14278:526-1329(+)
MASNQLHTSSARHLSPGFSLGKPPLAVASVYNFSAFTSLSLTSGPESTPVSAESAPHCTRQSWPLMSSPAPSPSMSQSPSPALPPPPALPAPTPPPALTPPPLSLSTFAAPARSPAAVAPSGNDITQTAAYFLFPPGSNALMYAVNCRPGFAFSRRSGKSQNGSWWLYAGRSSIARRSPKSTNQHKCLSTPATKAASLTFEVLLWGMTAGDDVEVAVPRYRVNRLPRILAAAPCHLRNGLHRKLPLSILRCAVQRQRAAYVSHVLWI